MSKLAICGGKKMFPKGLALPTWPQFDQRDEAALLKAFRSGQWWRGGTVEEQAASQCGRFERAFAKYHDAPYGLVVCNGTIAVELALRAAGVKAGDEVIVPALSFVVSASAALPLGAVPIFADADPLTCQMDPDAIEAAITPRTAAIVIVHFGGYPADLDRIKRIARKHKLPLIEDCAHAQGSQWRGKGVGSHGDFGTFSFQQSKSLTCGEGGIVLCRTLGNWRKLYRFHNLGRPESKGFYDFHEMSSNYRMTNLQGALLNSQFRRLPDQVRKRMAGAKHLSKLLRAIGGIEPLPDDPRITRRGYYYYICRYDARQFKGLGRDAFLDALRAEGIVIGRGYGTAIHKYPLFQKLSFPAKYKGARYSKLSLPVSERLCKQEICTLHQISLLMDKSELAKVARAIEKVKANVDELL